jgi:hypothetical protein
MTLSKNNRLITIERNNVLEEVKRRVKMFLRSMTIPFKMVFY